MIELKHVSKSFVDIKKNTRAILANFSLKIEDGEFVTIFGPNGSGKSTLVNLISGIEKPTSGEIIGIDKIRNELGFVFQDYRKSLLPWANVRENILFPLHIRGVSKKDSERRLQSILELTDIRLDLKQSVTTLSGGQAQSVSILRALIINPKLLILDEPFAALDYERTLSLRKLISEVAAKLHLAVIFISHDLEEAISLGDRTIFLTRPPTSIHHILSIPEARPRSMDFLLSDNFARLRKEGLEAFYKAIKISS